MIINLAMLEHTANPKNMVQEMHRVLKFGGTLFCYVPFIVPFHAAPDDYFRWTETGCKELFSMFSDFRVHIGSGPTSGALWVFQEWLSILLSFGSKIIHDIILIIFMVITAPVKLLDILLEKHPQAQNISSGFLVVCKK